MNRELHLILSLGGSASPPQHPRISILSFILKLHPGSGVRARFQLRDVER